MPKLKLSVQNVLQPALIVLSRAAPVGGALIAGLLAASSLGPVDRGTMAIWLQVGYTISMATPLGMDRSLFASQSRSQQQIDRAGSLTGQLTAMSVVSIALTGVLTACSSGPQVLVLCAAIASLVFANGTIRLQRTIAILNETMSKFLVGMAGVQIVLAIGAFVLFRAQAGLGSWLTLYAAAHVAGAVILRLPRFSEWIRVSSATREEGLYAAAGLSTSAAGKADRFVLPVAVRPTDFGVYATFAPVIEAALWLPISVFEHSLSKEDGRSLRTSRVLTMGLLLVAGLSCFAATFVLSRVLGGEYQLTATDAALFGAAALAQGATKLRSYSLLESADPVGIFRLDLLTLFSFLAIAIGTLLFRGEESGLTSALVIVVAAWMLPLLLSPRLLKGHSR